MVRRPVIRSLLDLRLGRRRVGAGIRCAFDHQVLLGKIAHLAMQFDLIAGHLARVFNADVVATKTERLDEGNGVLDDFAIGYGGTVRSGISDADGRAGQVRAVHLELIGVFLRADLRIELSLPFSRHGRHGVRHAFGNDVIFGEVADLAVQMQFIVGERACIFNGHIIVLNFERFAKRDFVIVKLEVGEGHVVCAVVPLTDGAANQIGAVHLELVGVFLRADLGIKLGLPFSDHAVFRADNSGHRQRARRQPECFDKVFHG